MNLRLYADAQVNEHWTVKSRVEYKSDMNSSKNVTGTSTNSGSNDFVLNRAYAEGVYGNTVIDLGKFPAYTTLDQGMKHRYHL